MQRKYKVLIVSGVVLVVVLVGGYFGAREVWKRRINGWRAQGMAAAQAGDHARAADYLARYLSRRGWDEEALSVYAKEREQAEEPDGRHIAQAIVALRQLVGMDPDRLDDRRHLLELYDRVERRPEALDTANAILEKHPNDVPTLRIKTATLLAMGQYRDALDTAQKWSAVAPLDVQAYLDRMTARAGLGQSAEVIVGDAKALADAHGDDPRFRLVLGSAYAMTGNMPLAAQSLEAAAAHPDTLPEDVAKPLVQQLDRAGLTGDALRVMQAEAKSGRSAALKDLYAKRLWEIGRWADVMSVLGDLDPATADPTLAAFKAIAAANLGKKDEAARIRTALAARTQSAAARVWSATLDHALDHKPLDEKTFAADCRSALALDGQNVYVLYQLGDSYARQGEPELAINAWKAARQISPEWPAPTVRLADELIQRGRAAEALAIISRMAAHGPMQTPIAISMARAWAAAIDTGTAGGGDQLLRLVTDIQQKFPLEPVTYVIRVKLLAGRGGADKEQAAGLIRDALAHKPPLPEQQLLALAAVSRQYGMGLDGQCFEAVEQAYGANPAMALTKAAAVAADHGAGAGLQAFDELAKKSGKDTDLSWRVARATYLDNTASPDAPAAWKALAEENAKNVAVQEAALSARTPRGDRAFQEATIDRLKTLTGENGLAWRMAKARLLVEQARGDSDYEQGSVVLDQVIKRQPGLAEAQALLGRALMRMQRNDGAIDHLTLAARLDPTSVPVALDLATLLKSRGDNDGATRQISRVEPMLRTPQQRRQAAMLFAQMGNSDRATQLLEQDTAATTRPAEQDQLLLATLYNQRREYDKVDAILEKLLARPDLATVQFASAYYTARGQSDKAERALAMLDSLQLQPGVKQLIQASHFAQTGDLPKAEAAYRAATQQVPGDALAWRMLATTQVGLGHIGDALATIASAAKAVPSDESFKTLGASAALINDSAASDAGRTQPVIIAAVRDPGSTAQCMALLQVLADWRSSADSDKAASQLQQLVDKYPKFLPARMQLISCDQSMGRTGDAIAAAQQAASDFPTDPAPARLAVELSAASRRWDTLRQAAEVWRKRVPNDTPPVDLMLARADIAQKDYATARTRLAPYAAQASGSPEEHADVLVLEALTEADGGQQPAPVTEQIWSLAAKSPAWRARCVQMAAEIQDPARAVAWLDRLAGITPAGANGERVQLAEAYDTVSAANGDDPATTAKATALYDALMAQPKVPAPALMSGGIHAERVKDDAKAETLYRRALALDPKNWVIENNLAMVLLRQGHDLPEALALAGDAAKSQPRIATVRDTLAAVQAKSGDPKSAADNMQVAIRIDPDNAYWRVRLAKYLLAAGDRIGASKVADSIDDQKLTAPGIPKDARGELDAVHKRLKELSQG